MTWEAIVMLHAAGDRLKPEKLLKKYPRVQATVYLKGKAATNGGTHRTSGFGVDLGTVHSTAELEEQVLKHLHDHAALYEDVAKQRGHVSVGIGLMVPPKEPRTLTLTRGTLAALLAAGVAIHITGYPWTDEKGEEASDSSEGGSRRPPKTGP